ncbi:hypothetical protein [Chitinilyticum aquatile]|uniref:hypothetical protein n=1 Tax=Chitinilyticum aquatile TaxID=362520 RepID=UPI0012DFA749|nr:hypothetical protein [Chitinilyticum aquatile]
MEQAQLPVSWDIQMPKYQFFKRSSDGQDEVCYLCTDHARFLPDREQLLAQGFEVAGYMIHAPDEAVAIERFNAEMACPLLETPEGPATSNELKWYREVVLKYIRDKV